MDIRGRFFGLLSKYWWVLALVVAAGLMFTNSPIFKYLIWIFAVPFLIMMFFPFFVQIFAPAFFLISSLANHFKESKNMSFGKKYIFIPMALLSAVIFILAQTILSIWVFFVSFIIWADLIGGFWATLLIFFFGLAPLAIVTAPFILWFKAGFVMFLSTGIFFLMALFWYGLSKLALSENYSSTPDDYLGYSPHTFLLGALAAQIIALPFYQFKAIQIGSAISDIGGIVFLFLTGVAAIKWHLIKRRLSNEERTGLYEPSIWAYILGFVITSFLFSIFNSHNISTVTLAWLNAFFAIAIINKFFCGIGNKMSRKQGVGI